MSSIPITESIGKTHWSQGSGENDVNLELRIPITLPDGVRPRNLTVEIKDSDVLCVSHQDTKLLQWRLFAPVSTELEWHVERDTTLVVELEKKSAVMWECLLNLPLRPDDELLTSREEIDRMFREQLPSLPAVFHAAAAPPEQNGKEPAAGVSAQEETGTSNHADRETGSNSFQDSSDGHTLNTTNNNINNTTTDKEDDNNTAATNEVTAGEEDSLEKLLDEAAKEVDTATNGASAASDAEQPTAAAAAPSAPPPSDEEKDVMERFIKAELDNYAVEEREIRSKMAETDGALAAGEGGAVADATLNGGSAVSAAQKQKAVLDRMMAIHDEMREVRTRVSSLDNFMEYTKLDLQKSRANVGHLSAQEEEEFASVEERNMTPTELMTRGLQSFENRDVNSCLHFLRLAAIHHHHDQSIVLLYTLCSQINSPAGTSLLLERALDDAAPSGLINFKVGELYDRGARHFLPIFPAAVYFYERAARQGSVTAMLALAQLWERGATASSMLTEDRAKSQQSLAKYHGWLDRAMDRGCGVAYFVKGCMYLKGENGVDACYARAKDYLDAAHAAQPNVLSQAPLIPSMLEALRKSEEQRQLASPTLSNGKTPTSSATATSRATPTSTTAASASSATQATRAGAVKPPAAAPLRPTPRGVAEVADADLDDEDALMAVAPAARMDALRSLPVMGAASAGAGPKGGAVTRPNKMAAAGGGRGGSSSSKDRRLFWERTCKTALVTYGVYTLLFPLRVMMLPTFYSLIGGVVSTIPWLANRNMDYAALF